MSDQEKELTTAILVFAHYLGIDLDAEPELVHIAEEAFDKLPPDWEFGIGEDEHAGIPYFYNTVTDQSDWKHPEEEKYINKVKKERKALQEKRAQKNKRNDSNNGNNNRNASGFSGPRGGNNDTSSNSSQNNKKKNEDTVEVMDFEDDDMSPIKGNNNNNNKSSNANKGSTLNNPTAAPALTAQKSQSTSFGMSADDFLDDEPDTKVTGPSSGTSGSKTTTADNSPPLFKEKSSTNNDRAADSRNQSSAGNRGGQTNSDGNRDRDGRDTRDREGSSAQSDAASSRGRDSGIGSNQSRNGSLLYSSQSPERGRQSAGASGAGGSNRREEGSPINYRTNPQFQQQSSQQQQQQQQQGTRNNVTFREGGRDNDTGSGYRGNDYNRSNSSQGGRGGGGGGGRGNGGGESPVGNSRSDSRERGRDTGNNAGRGGGGGGASGGYGNNSRNDDYNRGGNSNYSSSSGNNNNNNANRSGAGYSNSGNQGGTGNNGGSSNSDRYQGPSRAVSANSALSSNAAAATAALSADMEAYYQQQIQRLQDAREDVENKMSSLQKKHAVEITSHLDNIRRLESKVLDEKHEQHSLQDKISAMQLEHSAKLRDVEETYELKLREASRKAKLETDEDWKEKQRVSERKHTEELEALRGEAITLKRRFDDATREVENMKRKVSNSKVDGMLEVQGEADAVKATLRELEESHRVQTIELRKARDENVTLNSRLISAIQASQIAVAEAEAAKNISANAVHESSTNNSALMQATHRIMQLDSDLAVVKAENSILHKEKESVASELRKLQGTIGFHGDKLTASESEARRIKANSQAEIARLTSKTVELDALVNVLRTQLDNATDSEVSSVREVRRDLEKSECEVIRLRDRLTDAEVREDSLNTRIKSLEKELLKQQEVTFKKERLMKDETQKIDVLTNRISEMRFEHEREVEKLKGQLNEHQRVYAELQQRHKQELERVQAEESAKLPLMVQSAVEKIEYSWGKKFAQEVQDLEANYEKLLEKQKREIFELKRASIEKESELKLAQTEERVELDRLRNGARQSRRQVEELEQTVDDLKRELKQEMRTSMQLRNGGGGSNNQSRSGMGRSQMRESRGDWNNNSSYLDDYEDGDFQLAQLQQQRRSHNGGWRTADQDEVMRGMDENDRNLYNSRDYSRGGGNNARNQRDFQEQNSFESQAVSLINTQLSLMKQQMNNINSSGPGNGSQPNSGVKKSLRLPHDHMHQHQSQQAYGHRGGPAPPAHRGGQQQFAVHSSVEDYQVDDVSVDNHPDISYVDSARHGNEHADSEAVSEAEDGAENESHPVAPTHLRPPLHSSGSRLTAPTLHQMQHQHVKFTSDSPSSRLFSTPTAEGLAAPRNQGSDRGIRPNSLSAHMALVDDNISLISQSLLDESSVLNSSRVAPDSAHFVYQPSGRSSSSGGVAVGRYDRSDFDAQPSAILNSSATSFDPSSNNYMHMDYSRMSAASFHKYQQPPSPYRSLYREESSAPPVNRGLALQEEVDALLQAGSAPQFDNISDGGYYEGYWKAKYSGSKNKDR